MRDQAAWLEWQAAFDQHTEIMAPAELHGLLTGLMTLTEPIAAADWQQLLTDLGYDPLDDASMRLLTDEGSDIFDELSEDAWAFEPLLPDEDQPLSLQAKALADWALGFMLGVGLSGVSLHADEIELIDTLEQIAQLDSEAIEGESEQQAGDLMELQEFVRLAPATLREAHTPSVWQAPAKLRDDIQATLATDAMSRLEFPEGKA